MKIKLDYPQLKKKYNEKILVYLDSACTALKSKVAIESQKFFLENFGNCYGNRGSYIPAQKSSELIEEARNYIASFLNTGSDEIIFTSGTTESFNILANSFKFEKNDEIIISALEHNSVFLPFYETSKRKNLKLKIIPLKNFQPDINKFRKLITKKTKLLCITAASNLIGGITKNLSDFITIAHKNNIKVFVDAAQYITSHKIDVKKLKADALAFSGHKLGAPFGTGVLYINSKLYNYLSPFKVGGGTIQDILIKNSNIKISYLSKNKMFEAGILNYSGIYALYKTIYELNEKIEYNIIRKHIKELINYSINRLSKIPEIKIIGENQSEGSIISFKFKNNKYTIKDFLLYSVMNPKYIIAFRTGKMCANISSFFVPEISQDGLIRISFFIYNSTRDVDIFIKNLKNYIETANKK